MPELNFVSTSPQDATGAKGLLQQPYTGTVTPGYNYGGAGQPTGNGFMEFGSGTPGSLPFRVDQAGNVTAASFKTGTPGSGSPTLALQASTGISGYALANGTGTVISWTTPDDGLLHRLLIVSSILVSSSETGGLIQVTWRGPGATTDQATQLFASNLGAGTPSQAPNTSGSWTLAPNTTVAVKQNSALTGGAATLYAEIWGA